MGWSNVLKKATLPQRGAHTETNIMLSDIGIYRESLDHLILDEHPFHFYCKTILSSVGMCNNYNNHKLLIRISPVALSNIFKINALFADLHKHDITKQFDVPTYCKLYNI